MRGVSVLLVGGSSILMIDETTLLVTWFPRLASTPVCDLPLSMETTNVLIGVGNRGGGGGGGKVGREDLTALLRPPDGSVPLGGRLEMIEETGWSSLRLDDLGRSCRMGRDEGMPGWEMMLEGLGGSPFLPVGRGTLEKEKRGEATAEADPERVKRGDSRGRYEAGIDSIGSVLRPPSGPFVGEGGEGRTDWGVQVQEAEGEAMGDSFRRSPPRGRVDPGPLVGAKEGMPRGAPKGEKLGGGGDPGDDAEGGVH